MHLGSLLELLQAQVCLVLTLLERVGRAECGVGQLGCRVEAVAHADVPLGLQRVRPDDGIWLVETQRMPVLRYERQVSRTLVDLIVGADSVHHASLVRVLLRGSGRLDPLVLLLLLSRAERLRVVIG